MDVYTLAQLAHVIGATIVGDSTCRVQNISAIEVAKPGDLTFLTDDKYKAYLPRTQASAVLLAENRLPQCPAHALVSADPKLALIKLLHFCYPQHRKTPGIHPTAIISNSAQIDSSAYIGPYTVVEDDVVIGPRVVIEASCFIARGTQINADCYLHPRVTVYATMIGARSIIQSGVVLGADGFGFAQDETHNWIRVPQIGRTIIGEDAEIGASTTIDRGAIHDTVIGNGVKLDSLVRVGHNVRIGDHTVIAGCTGIAGSVSIGRYCMIGGLVGINGHIDICDHVMITSMSGVAHSITEPGIYSSGPGGVQPNREWRRNRVYARQLHTFHQRLTTLEKLYDPCIRSSSD